MAGSSSYTFYYQPVFRVQRHDKVECEEGKMAELKRSDEMYNILCINRFTFVIALDLNLGQDLFINDEYSHDRSDPYLLPLI